MIVFCIYIHNENINHNQIIINCENINHNHNENINLYIMFKVYNHNHSAHTNVRQDNDLINRAEGCFTTRKVCQGVAFTTLGL